MDRPPPANNSGIYIGGDATNSSISGNFNSPGAISGAVPAGGGMDERARRRPRRVILLMSANPDGTGPLRLDEERREIDRVVTYAQAGDRLEVRTADALRLDDLHSSLMRHRPVIAHFSGHGTASDGIVVTDEYGQPQPVPAHALSELFAILKGELRCVVLNACFTEEQARAIAVDVPCVVGMHSRVLDRTAIRFAAGFYQAIAHGFPVRQSYELGCNQLKLHGHWDSEVPRLMVRQDYVDRPIIDPRA